MRDWENKQCNIGKLGLNDIMNQAKEVKDPFGSILFTHVYRDFNTQEIFLSKEALIMYEYCSSYCGILDKDLDEILS